MKLSKFNEAFKEPMEFFPGFTYGVSAELYPAADEAAEVINRYLEAEEKEITPALPETLRKDWVQFRFAEGSLSAEFDGQPIWIYGSEGRRGAKPVWMFGE